MRTVMWILFKVTGTRRAVRRSNLAASRCAPVSAQRRERASRRPRGPPRGTYLPLVELLRRRRPQADQAVVLDNGAGALARRGEALHLRHIIKALLDVAEVARLGRGLVVGVGVPAVVALFVVARAALRAAALLSQLHLALQKTGGG